MKLLLAFLMLLSLSVSAEPITIILNGVKHLCTPARGNPAQCVETAYKGVFSRDESNRICAGAFDVSPALCAIEAYKGILGREESIDLCIKAYSPEPATCFKLAYSGPFSRDESTRLCRRTGTDAIAVCALQAYRGVYSKEESIELCRQKELASETKLSPLGLRAKKLVVKISKDELDQLIKEVNIKAVERKEYK